MAEVFEHGDRAAFLRRVRSRLDGGVASNRIHPPPAVAEHVPRLVHLGLDADDLEGSFIRAATAMGATVHTDEDDVAAIVATHAVRTAVVTAEPETGTVAGLLRAAGVDVRPYDPVPAASADLGLTATVAAVAATGSVVLDSAVAGGRGASLLPPVHLCVVPRDRLVATPGDVLRPFTDAPDVLPANLVFITGPSRTGDIEQILTVGVHGPIAVHCLIVDST